MTQELATIEDNTTKTEKSILGYIDVDSIFNRVQSDDPMVRLEAKLDYVINVTANMGEGMSSALDQMQDSPIGRMLGNLIGVNGD